MPLSVRPLPVIFRGPSKTDGFLFCFLLTLALTFWSGNPAQSSPSRKTIPAQGVSAAAGSARAEPADPAPLRERVTALVETKIRTAVSSSESLTVEIIPSVESSEAGAFKRIRVSASGAVIKGLRLQSLEMTVRDMVIDAAELIGRGRMAVIDRGTASIALEVSEGDINGFLSGRAEELRLENPKVKFLDGSIIMSGKCKWWLVDAAFETRGTFTISEGVEVHYSPEKIVLSNLDMPRFVVARLIRKVNPVMTLDGFPFELALKRIELTDGWLKITGE